MTVAHLPFESRTGHDPALGIGVAAVESVWVVQADKRVINDLADARSWPEGSLAGGQPSVADKAYARLRAAIVHDCRSQAAAVQPVVERDIGPPNAAIPLQLLRTWTALPMADLASLLGVSRRTLYEWQRGSEARDENRVRLDRLIDLVGPLAEVIGSGATRTFLRDQLQSGEREGVDVDRLADEAAQLRRSAERPVLRPRTVTRVHVEPDAALSGYEMRVFLEGRAAPREPIAASRWQPHELMPAPVDEQ
ncbi:MAG: hypothetical protein M3406_16160 [Chloroflexota bacterium]|nr:hypothetical protein [Chloroflexota bacterium]